MMKKILGVVAAAALITTVFAGCSTGEVGGTTSSKADGSSETKLTGTLTMAGSTSMTDVCTALNEAFMKKNSGVKVVLNGGGSGDEGDSYATRHEGEQAVAGCHQRFIRAGGSPGAYVRAARKLLGARLGVRSAGPFTGVFSRILPGAFRDVS